ncbi:MAG TPA: hypothetical protein VFE14_20910 [Micromonosporaceae bacterium]|nr:hypothetical protein [Micromonosporaceae bacterium]
MDTSDSELSSSATTVRPRLSNLPGFLTPAHLRSDPLPATDHPVTTPQSPDLPPEPHTPRPAPDATRTPTSDTTGDGGPKPPDAKTTAKLVAGLIGLVVVGAAALIAHRRGRELRQPTGEQLDDIAAPIARIALRHVPAGLLSADLADAMLAASATGAYLSDGPLLSDRLVDTGLPGPDEDWGNPS